PTSGIVSKDRVLRSESSEGSDLGSAGFGVLNPFAGLSGRSGHAGCERCPPIVLVTECRRKNWRSTGGIPTVHFQGPFLRSLRAFHRPGPRALGADASVSGISGVTMMTEQRMNPSQHGASGPAVRSGHGRRRRWFLRTLVALAVGVFAAG